MSTHNTDYDATCPDCGHWWEEHQPVCQVGGIPCGCLQLPDSILATWRLTLLGALDAAESRAAARYDEGYREGLKAASYTHALRVVPPAKGDDA